MEKKTYAEGDIILCTVDKIEGTTVFIKIDAETNGTMITSEIAPGRIRNLREYVVPNKKIVCKILRISQGNIDLSLRRVTGREKSDALELYKQEQTAKSALNSLLKERAKEVEEKILSEFKSLGEFFIKAKEDESLLTKHIPKEFIEQIAKIVQKRKKDIEVKKIAKLKCLESDGITRIKDILESQDTELEITYISAGNFQVKVKSQDYKKANLKINQFLEELEKKAKKNSCEFSIEETKQ